jgi:predicted Zn-dependent protease with MMP-like domain
MFQISDDQFAGLIEEAFETLPPAHVDAIKNVAIYMPTTPRRPNVKS